MQNHLKRKAGVVAMAVVIMAAGAPVFAQDAQQKTPPVRNYNPAPKTGKKYVATREIIFDKATGILRLPTADETQALADQISSLTNRSSENLTVTRTASGGRMMNLQGGFGSVVLGRALADGTTENRCVTTLEEAVTFLGLEESVSQQ